MKPGSRVPDINAGPADGVRLFMLVCILLLVAVLVFVARTQPRSATGALPPGCTATKISKGRTLYVCPTATVAWVE